MLPCLAGTVLEACKAPPPAPACSGPSVHLNTKYSVKAGRWDSQEYYLTAGSEWAYTVASSELITVLYMTMEGYSAWQGKPPRWGAAAADLASTEPRPQGILGAHHVQPGAAESRSWRVEEEGRYLLVMVPSYVQGSGLRAVTKIALDLRVSRTAHCPSGASVSSTQREGGWMELDEGSAGFIMHVPQAAEVAQTRPVKEYFRCRAEDEELEKYAALVYSDLVRGGIHLMVVALILLVSLKMCAVQRAFASACLPPLPSPSPLPARPPPARPFPSISCSPGIQTPKSAEFICSGFRNHVRQAGTSHSGHGRGSSRCR